MMTRGWVAFLFWAVVISGCDRGSAGLATLDGGSIDTTGKILLVNYWAEWCKPCREEIPELNRFDREHENVLVLGVNYDAPAPERSRAQAQELGIEFPVLASDPSATWGRQRPEVLPTTLVIDSDGRWVTTLVGPQTEEDLQRAVASLSSAGEAD
ncbi:TlpA family protein disulfide reductase [Microbulbifer yueqingensis]|uniref:Thiol-disulfide isomerase or thioredoxin n=1 Tax=Microbulbifer yueqingensis TaxID=658219 RepID=A0A1G8V1P0_9GAMM|nr:TlpA disulfide reductase family protein [Microbulbifer yueqingensis]SDJ60016.1 Thiol-disulfide isomerase or thioredoxin [Microbulbifer yueqingensis]